MKNIYLTLLFAFSSIAGFSQNAIFEYSGRFTPSVKKEKLHEFKYIDDLTPELFWNLLLPYSDREELEERVKVDFANGQYVFPKPGDFKCAQANYINIIDIVSTELTVTRNGKTLKSQSKSAELTAEQKEILNSVDLGADIPVVISFKYKKQATDQSDSEEKIIMGEATVTVVPEVEAEFPGGNKKLSEYFTQNVFDKISETSSSEKIRQAVVKFVVNEDGQIVDAKVSRTSSDPQLDRLLLEATVKMPKWNPAKNSKGIKVKQQFSIPLGSGGGC